MPASSPLATGNFLTVDRHRLHYRVQGSGPALILVHGMLGSTFSWRRNVDFLARRFRVYALDLPGLGLSTASPRYRFSFGAAAELIHRFARAVGERGYALCGHSLGGTFSLLCAARHPEAVSRLALVAPATPFSHADSLKVKLGSSVIAGNLLFWPARLLPVPVAKYLFRHSLYGSRTRADRATIEGYITPLMRRGVIPLTRRMLAAWDMASVEAAFPKVKAPVLLVWGEDDRVVPVSSAVPLAAALNARLRVVARCGHLVAEEAPDTVNRILLDFLGRPTIKRKLA